MVLNKGKTGPRLILIKATPHAAGNLESEWRPFLFPFRLSGPSQESTR
jgi:hypothetical protein